MGFDHISSHLIIFIAVLLAASGVSVILKGISDSTSHSILEQQNRLVEQLDTNIAIDSVSYNNDTKTTLTYIRNTGSTKLKIEKIDIYIDGIRILRDENNRTIQIENDTQTINMDIWDPNELVKIEVFKTLEEEKTHEVMVSTNNNIKDSSTISV